MVEKFSLRISHFTNQTKVNPMKIISLISRQKDHSTASIWSVDRIARLIVGIANIFFLLATYFISPYFLIGLCFVNLNLIFTSMTDNCPFKNLLKKLGAKEREEIISSNGELIQDKKR